MADGAEIIDIGAESARTNRAAMSEAEEAARLVEFAERWQANCAAENRVLLSINTWRPACRARGARRGGDLLNDIGGLPTDENARICAETGAALLIMHSVGEPKIAAHRCALRRYHGRRWRRFLHEKIALAEAAGLSRDAIVLDPGIDFAKQRADNLRIYRELDRLAHFERPILLPVSRKTVIGEVLHLPDPAERDAGTAACIVQGDAAGRAHFPRA